MTGRGRVAAPAAAILAAALAALSSAACHSARPGDFDAGERALREGRLVQALRILDAVPVFDIRYPEARLQAAALERRLRRHKEMLLLGLRLRGEWRDREALVAFRNALDEWPGHEETLDLIEATEGRLHALTMLRARVGRHRAALGDDDFGAPPAAAVSIPRDRGAEGRDRVDGATRTLAGGGPADHAAVPAPVQDVGAPAGAETAVDLAEPPVTPRAASPAAPMARAITDDVARELTRIVLESYPGDIDQVLARLQALQREWPDDQRVTVRLAQLFQQRGLMRYGNGDVAAAITDWQRAMALDPGLTSARALFGLATAELARPSR